MAEKGTHDQLMQQNGYYAELYRMQLEAAAHQDTQI